MIRDTQPLAPKGKTMSKVYDIITNKFVDQLKAGVVPWQKPWKCRGMPLNLQSGKPYNGVNRLLLYLAPYTSPYWVTYKQATQCGGHVRKGEKGTEIIFFTSYKDKKNNDKVRPVMRYYRVFNVEQCEGVDYPKEVTPEFNPIEQGQAVIDGFTDCPPIHWGGNSAAWNPRTDQVLSPKPEQFKSPEYYYAVMYHELIHSTGHESRSGRLAGDASRFGSGSYAKEELVAEVGSAFLLHHAGIDASGLFDNSAGYIAGWLKALNNDTRLIVQASKLAAQAADYILQGKPEEATTKEVTTTA